MNKPFLELQDVDSKCLSYFQGSKSVWLNEMTKLIQDLKTEINNERETLKRTQIGRKMEFKKADYLYQETRGKLANIINQAQGRISGFQRISRRLRPSKQ